MSLIDARPPAEVAADFVAAQAAESHRDRRRTEARPWPRPPSPPPGRLPVPAGERRGATPSASSSLRSAEAQRFLALLAEAQRSRPLTLQRIYLDTMKSLLGRVRRKVVLPPGDVVDLTVLGLEE